MSAATRWWWVRHAPVVEQAGRLYGQTDLAMLAEAYGARGERIEKPGDLAPALMRALAADVTTVLDVRTDPWQVHYRAPEFAEFHKF